MNTNTFSKKNNNTKSSPTPEINLCSEEVYFAVLQNEYQIERSKKESFESRISIILTILAAITVFVFEKIKLYDIIPMILQSLSFLFLLKIISGLGVYISFFVCVFFSVNTISTSSHLSFNPENITNQVLAEQKFLGLGNLIMTYKKIIIDYRKVNEKKANSLKKALITVIVCLICICIYINIPIIEGV